MDYSIVYVIVGAVVILAAWIPLFIDRVPLSLPMIAIAGGWLLAACGVPGNPIVHNNALMLRLAEFALLLSVLGAGLKIDRRFSFAGWTSTWRLLSVVMLASMVAIAAAGYWLLGVSPGLAFLLGAILAPTDPVLSSSFRAGPPGLGEEGETKFALTSEAGLNDGLAYPFVALGLLLAGGGGVSGADLSRWLALDLVWDVCAGALVGVALGWALVQVNRLLPERMRLATSNSGLVSVGLAFLAYGIATMIDGNGFVAVFCEAAAIRNFAASFEYSKRLNHAAEQFERIGMVLILTLLGVAAYRGIFAGIGLAQLAYLAVVLLLVRPATVLIGFLGSRQDKWTRAALGGFGIRGIASLYYVSFAGTQLAASAEHRLIVMVSLVIVGSVVLYGTTAETLARYLTPEDG